jgi:hypothetical protein
MAERHSPAMGSWLVPRFCGPVLLWRDAVPVVMAVVTKESGSRSINSIPDTPRWSNEIRRGIPDGSVSTSCARRARMTVQTCFNTSVLMDVGSRFACPSA